MLSAILWTSGAVCIVLSWGAGEIAGESLYRPAKYRFTPRTLRLICIGAAVAAALCWRAA